MKLSTKIPLILLASIILKVDLSSAQTPSQLIRGLVVDGISQQPLIGATIEVMDLATVTNLDGSFELENIPVGRHQVICRYLGYQTAIIDDLLINSAKESFIKIELDEIAIEADEVVVRAFSHPHEPLNDLSMVSTRSFSADETQRYPASANDPSRMAVGFPGVKPARDNRNDLVIRGNPAFGLLWRLEGVDIPNPNHFARIGSSGGGITIFSVGMLDKSDFSAGAFAANYGNAISGVFDIHFRNGNKDNQEYTARAGMLGLDFSAEGPIKKGKSSYLFNYRYSTLGILDAFNIHLVDERESNTFQDLAFKTHFASGDNKHQFSLWGMGGLSKEREDAVANPEDWVSFGDYYTRAFDTKMGVIGINYRTLLDDQSYLKISLAGIGQGIQWRNDSLNSQEIPSIINDENYSDRRVALNGTYIRKISQSISAQVGLHTTRISYDLSKKKTFPQTHLSIDERGSTFLLQPYSNFTIHSHARWTFSVGIHSVIFTLNKSYSLEPRLSIRYHSSENSSFSIAYGKHSVTLPIGHYFARIKDLNGNNSKPNVDLKLLKSHHFIASFQQQFSRYRLNIEPYLQFLDNIPIGIQKNDTYSLINEIDGFTTKELISEGTATNIGIDITLEKYFSNKSFFILNSSLSNSQYETLDGVKRNTRFNSNFFSSFMGGKEWNVSTRSTLQLGTRILYGLGGYITPTLSAFRNVEDPSRPLLDHGRAFTERVSSYFRPDLRISYRKNGKKASWTLSLDVQNVASIKNIDVIDYEFNAESSSWGFRTQASAVPVLSYQVDF